MSQVPSLREAVGQLARLARLIRPYWKRLLQGFFLALLLGAVGMATPFFTKILIDEVYPNENAPLMHVAVGVVLALGLSSAVLGAINGYFTLFVNSHLNSAARLLFFNHLQHLKADFFDRHQVGEINSRFQDVGQALQALGNIFQTIFVQGVYLIFVPPMLFWLEWRLALIALVTLPLILTITAMAGRLLRRSWQRSSEAYADLNAFQIETLSHIRTFKTMGLEHQVYQRASDSTTHALREQVRAGGLSQALNAATTCLHALNTALFTWYGWTLILNREMTLGEFLAFSAYVGFLYGPLTQFIQLFSGFQQSAIHLSRMFEYLDEPVEQDPRLAYAPPPELEIELRGAFRLRGVGFSYETDREILRDVDLEFPAGSVTAVVGPSGSGKTTLLRLLARLIEPTRGEILLDGRPPEEIRLSDLRRQLAVVWQDVSLLKGSLWDNLVLGSESATREEATRDEAERVVRLCGLEELLRDLPQGFETPVAEWGSSLSAGQRQRVALARALLRRAPILLLDEATANIDVETEMEILQSLFQPGLSRSSGSSTREATIVFVTHRLAGAALADRICVLEQGEVQGVGAHSDLLESCATYRRMWSAGDGDFSSDASRDGS